ncbi:O-methyltransferase [Salinicoccus sp. ID82-1]|uniref:O-methyltransferase n=1 Tax=Salinicoccus sp. ID82-1 TaxID=2820269 RepID=UPI001F15A2FD|nr:O-methyltransferase [Salinicoccus sp. ID82-1]MCG1008887.1 O-methyltransferase [Salinicoccus sp. ID82-1]
MDIYEYIRNLNARPEAFPEMLAYAKRHDVPIMDEDALNVMKHYMKLARVKNVLEIGTAIGYSAMHMLSVDDSVSVVTIEKDEDAHRTANAFFTDHGVSHRVLSVLGDAKEVPFEALGEAPFDLLFIDASKGNNQRFYERYLPLVKTGGLIIVDNILIRGLVVQDGITARGTRRMKEKVDGFNRAIAGSGTASAFLPVGDGLLVIIKDEKEELR